MINVERIKTWGFEHAIRGMRNPGNSWDKSDSYYRGDWYIIGKDDMDLAKGLVKAGVSHRKFLRQIFVSMDITAPLYWWKEFDTYKVGVVADSCSTMHKIHDKEFEPDDFSNEHMSMDSCLCLEEIIKVLNDSRHDFISTGLKEYWWQMIQLLPSSYNQMRTVTMNYENVLNIIEQRSNHKLDEWKYFITILKEELPYLEYLL